MAKAKRKASQEEQSARFVVAAREAGVDETGKGFDRAFKKLIPPKKGKRASTKDPR